MTILPAVGELSLASSRWTLPQSVRTMHQYMAMSIMAVLKVATWLPASATSSALPVPTCEMCSPAVMEPKGSPPPASASGLPVVRIVERLSPPAPPPRRGRRCSATRSRW